MYIILQEKTLFLTGGLTIHEDFIVITACNLNNETDHIYKFNINDQLDMDLSETTLTSRILSMSSR